MTVVYRHIDTQVILYFMQVVNPQISTEWVPLRSICLSHTHATFKMKILFIILLLLAILSRIANTCDVDMPSIMMSVQSTGRNILGSQHSTEFAVPLYADCNYRSPAAPVPADSKPTKTTRKHSLTNLSQTVQHQAQRSPPISRQILSASRGRINYLLIPKPWIASCKSWVQTSADLLMLILRLT